jgi:hypothetical protein
MLEVAAPQVNPLPALVSLCLIAAADSTGEQQQQNNEVNIAAQCVCTDTQQCLAGLFGCMRQQLDTARLRVLDSMGVDKRRAQAMAWDAVPSSESNREDLMMVKSEDEAEGGASEGLMGQGREEKWEPPAFLVAARQRLEVEAAAAATLAAPRPAGRRAGSRATPAVAGLSRAANAHLTTPGADARGEVEGGRSAFPSPAAAAPAAAALLAETAAQSWGSGLQALDFMVSSSGTCAGVQGWGREVAGQLMGVLLESSAAAARLKVPLQLDDVTAAQLDSLATELVRLCLGCT